MSYVISRVACAHGRPFMEVAREPYALTLFSFLHLADHEWITALLGEFRDLMRAKLTNFAVCGPERLEQHAMDLQVKIGLLPSAEESEAAAAQMIGPATAAVAQMIAEDAGA